MKIQNTGYSILYTLNKAYQGLKVLLDPAMEGNPYEKDTNQHEKRRSTLINTNLKWMPRRRFSFR